MVKIDGGFAKLWPDFVVRFASDPLSFAARRLHVRGEVLSGRGVGLPRRAVAGGLWRNDDPTLEA